MRDSRNTQRKANSKGSRFAIFIAGVTARYKNRKTLSFVRISSISSISGEVFFLQSDGFKSPVNILEMGRKIKHFVQIGGRHLGHDLFVSLDQGAQTLFGIP